MISVNQHAIGPILLHHEYVALCFASPVNEGFNLRHPGFNIKGERFLQTKVVISLGNPEQTQVDNPVYFYLPGDIFVHSMCGLKMSIDCMVSWESMQYVVWCLYFPWSHDII